MRMVYGQKATSSRAWLTVLLEQGAGCSPLWNLLSIELDKLQPGDPGAWGKAHLFTQDSASGAGLLNEWYGVWDTVEGTA